MNLTRLEAESSIDQGKIRRPAGRQMRQLIGGNGAATAAAQPVETIDFAGLTATYEPQHGLVARAAKRAFDVIGALLLIALLAPAWLVIAFLIKADSPGPILF